ncbi:MAG: hypothetical protein AAF203_04020 [Pseudomonadota bacterium]
MKKVSEIMEELGFRPEGSEEVKKAFVKNLMKQARVSEFSRLKEKRDNEPKDLRDPDQYKQISLFDQKVSS